MLTHARRVFTHDDLQVIRQSRYDRVLNSYSNVHALDDQGLYCGVKYYPSAPNVVEVGTLVRRGFSITPLFIPRNYVKDTVQWIANLSLHSRATLQNRLHRFDTAVQWTYALALVQKHITEGVRTGRGLVWTVSVFNFIQNRRAQLPQDERDDVYWEHLFHPVITNMH